MLCTPIFLTLVVKSANAVRDADQFFREGSACRENARPSVQKPRGLRVYHLIWSLNRDYLFEQSEHKEINQAAVGVMIKVTNEQFRTWIRRG